MTDEPLQNPYATPAGESEVTSAEPPGWRQSAVLRVGLSTLLGLGGYYLLTLAVFVITDRSEFWPEVDTGVQVAVVVGGATLYRVINPHWYSYSLRVIISLVVFGLTVVIITPLTSQIDALDTHPFALSPLTIWLNVAVRSLCYLLASGALLSLSLKSQR